MAVTIRDALRVKAIALLPRITDIRTKYGAIYKKFEGMLKGMQVDINDITARLLNLSDQ